ncbi:type III secretion apparatus assembly protein SctX [Alcaligenes sp. Marseille-Q7550]
MANLNVDRHLSFDHGIENILHLRRNEPETQGLPDRRNLTPSNDPVRTQLTQLLEKPNIGHVLEEALRPVIGNRELLTPSRFQSALQNVLKDLTELAEQAEQDGDARRILNRAIRVLKNEAGLRELLAMYRSALYQG